MHYLNSEQKRIRIKELKYKCYDDDNMKHDYLIILRKETESGFLGSFKLKPFPEKPKYNISNKLSKSNERHNTPIAYSIGQKF